jgi:serine/threonine protein kinase
MSASHERDIDRICNAFEDAWKQGQAPVIEQYLEGVSEAARADLLRELIHLDCAYQVRAQQTLSPDAYLKRFPDLDRAWLDSCMGAHLPARDVDAKGGDAKEVEGNDSRAAGAGAGGSTVTYSQEGDAPETRPDEGSRQPASLTIADRYEIGEMIARGGMGEVYAAIDRALQRDVAIKLVRADLVGTAAATRFLAEARILGQLQHPGIPPIHDVGVLPDGRPFLAMKLIKGRTLAALLKERPTPVEDLDRFVHVFEQICLAVAFAHAQGVIHRDLKPANVMVGSFGEVQVMDWGLAKPVRALVDAAIAADGSAPGFAATQHGAVLGTLPYMPPEQARGEIDRLDARSDVFGLGAILCVILTGKPPYRGSKVDALLQRACEGDVTDALKRVERSGAPVLVKQLARRCLAPDPNKRPAHAGEVANAIRSIHRIVESSHRKSELYDATAAAEDRQKAAWRVARISIAIGVMALVAAFVFTWVGDWWAKSHEEKSHPVDMVLKLSKVPDWPSSREEKSQAAVGLEWRARVALAREVFPLAIDGLAKDVATGTFRRGGAAAQERAASIKRFERILGDQEPKEQARGHLALAAAAAAIPDNLTVSVRWDRAAARYASAMPSSTEVDLAIAAVSWDFPEPLKQTVLLQASVKLRSALSRKGLTDAMRIKVTESLEAAERGLSDK